MVAPGTGLRAGLDRVLQAKRGALVVVGDDPAVLSICTGGFLLDAEFSPQRLSELAKMDGAIILAPDASRIARANVHLMPKASIPTTETGTRHRTAERVARSIEVPVVTVSEAMSTIAVYRNDAKHTIPDTGWLVDRASQALSTLQRFKSRFDLGLVVLSTLEVEDTVSVRDVVAVLQPGEMVVRIAEEIEGYLVELGEDGRLIGLQLEELEEGAKERLGLVIRDYVGSAPGAPSGRQRGGEAVDPGRREAQASNALRGLSTDDLLDGPRVASTLGLGGGPLGLDAGIEPRGYRLLHRLPRVSDGVIDSIVAEFGTLPRIMRASPGELEKAGGIGGAKARSLKDGLVRLAEATILERYD
jgi:diadenylate cyclase